MALAVIAPKILSCSGGVGLLWSSKEWFVSGSIGKDALRRGVIMSGLG